MADKGTTILDVAGGLSIATRDCTALDESSATRVVQRCVHCQGQVPSPIGSPSRAAIAAVDGSDLSNMPASFTSSLIDCTDKTSIVVFGRFNGGSASSSADIFAVWFDNEVVPAPIGVSMSDESLYEGTFLLTWAGGTQSATKKISFDVVGAAKVGIAVTSLNLDSATSLDLWFFAI